MRNYFNIALTMLLLLSMAGVPQAAQNAAQGAESSAYVEPALQSAEAATLSVIVSAGSAEAAAQAVSQVGGRVTADLWLVDGVAATITSASLDQLASIAGVRSVVANASVQSAQAPNPTTDGWDGYVSKKLVRRNRQPVGGSALVGMAALGNGYVAALGDDGSLVYFDGGGYQIASHQLKSNRPPLAISAGSGLVVVVLERQLSVFNEIGDPMWTVDLNDTFGGPATIQGNRLFVVVGQRWVYAYDAANGNLVWRTQLDDKHLGNPAGAPTVGADGRLYVAYTGDGSDPQGLLVAFDANGSIRYVMKADPKQSFVTAPLVGANGRVYAASEEFIYGVNSNGSTAFRFELPDDLLGAPVVGVDGVLYATVKGDRLLALNPNGSVRFIFRTGGSIVPTPVLSPDGDTVYVARKEKELFAVNAVTGSLRWQAATPDDFLVHPTVDGMGNVYAGDKSGTFQSWSSDGAIQASFNGYGPFTAPIVASGDGGAFLPTAGTVDTVTRLAKHWHGRKDVLDIGQKKNWDIINPFVIDIGADQLHSSSLSSGHKVTGEGVTVAVLDSGVYFDSQVRSELGQQVQKLFLGQVDLINRQCDTYKQGKWTYTSGLQYDNYCFTSASDSKDAYGHGTHVAGAIWNNMTDNATGVFLGVAPEAKILSVRVLDNHGNGSYADAIEGIQYVLQHKDYYGIRVLNMSISASPTTPYFVDPLNRAVMEAWAAGITVVAAAGNVGPLAESVTVPGNNPYVITVGAVDSQRTPGYWTGDILPRWSAAGPTFDGFLKPDVLAPGSQIVSFMYNDHGNNSASAQLVQDHPDYSANISLFRMNGTSMATAIASGVVALMLQVNPNLTPDQVKYRLMGSALPAVTEEAAPLYNRLQQGMGRIWAPAAVLAEFPADAAANQGMDIRWDLSHGYDSPEALAGHYQGPARKMISDDGQSILYYMEGPDGQMYGLGMADAQSGAWLDAETIGKRLPAWRNGAITLGSGINWAGGISLGAGMPLWSGGMPL